MQQPFCVMESSLLSQSIDLFLSVVLQVLLVSPNAGRVLCHNRDILLSQRNIVFDGIAVVSEILWRDFSGKRLEPLVRQTIYKTVLYIDPFYQFLFEITAYPVLTRKIEEMTMKTAVAVEQ